MARNPPTSWQLPATIAVVRGGAGGPSADDHPRAAPRIRTASSRPTDDPRASPAALRRGPRPADHLPARSRAARRGRRGPAVRRPDDAARRPRPLRHPAAARHGMPLDRLGVGAARSPDAARGAWRPLLRPTGAVFRGTGAGYWWRASCAEIFGVDPSGRRPTPPTRSTTRSPRRCPRARLPAARAAAATSASRCWPPPTTRPTTCPHAAVRDDPIGRGCCRPSAPTATSSPGDGLARAVDRLGAAADMDTGDYRGSSPRWRTAGATSSRTARSPPTTATPTPAPTRSSQAEAERISTGGPAGHGDARTRPPRFPRHMLLEMARMSGDDGLVMTMHPGVCRDHHSPTAAPVRRGHRPDIPVADASTPAALRPLLQRYGTAPEPAPGAVHSRRDDVLPRDRAAGRVLPVRLRGRAVVVPGRPGRDPPLPRRGHRDRRIRPARPASSTTPGRSARSPPGTTCRAGWTPATSPPGRRDTDSTRTRRRRRSTTSWWTTRNGRSSCDRRPPPSPAPPAPRSESPISGRATSSAPTRPGTPSTRRPPTNGASPRSPAAAATWPTTSPPRTACTRSSPATRTRTPLRSCRWWPRRRRGGRVAAIPRPTGGGARDPHRDRGGVPP